MGPSGSHPFPVTLQVSVCPYGSFHPRRVQGESSCTRDPSVSGSFGLRWTLRRLVVYRNENGRSPRNEKREILKLTDLSLFQTCRPGSRPWSPCPRLELTTASSTPGYGTGREQEVSKDLLISFSTYRRLRRFGFRSAFTGSCGS